MPDTIDEYVADNSTQITDINSRFVTVDSDRSRDLSFGSNFITIDVTVDVYTRTTGEQIIFGHPASSKGFSRGTFGDDKGEWTVLTDSAVSAELTKDGRKAVVEALTGQTVGIADGAYGGDDTAASTDDTALGSELARRQTFPARSGTVTNTETKYSSTQIVGTPGEFGVFDGSNRMLARVTIDESGLTVPVIDEVRAIVSLTFVGDGRGKAVLTTDGEEAVAEAIRSTTATVGLSEYAFGDGDIDFSKSDSALTSEVTRKNAGREAGRDRITAFTRLTEDDMSSITVDLSEVALFDSSGRMIWATTFRAVSSDSPGFNTDTTIVVV